MSLLNPSWSWDSASASSSSSTPLTSTQSSPKSMQCPTLLSLNPSTHSTPCPDTASGSNAFTSSVSSACSIASTNTSTISSSASSSSSTSSTSSTSTLQPSSSSQSQPYKSKSDAFFSFHSSMEPIKPPSPIFSRRASDSCLPPPCAVPPPSLTRSNAKASSSSSKGNSLRERYSSLPDIHERGIAPSSCSSSSKECASNTGLGIRSPPSHQLSSTSTLSSSSLLASSSTSSSAHSSGSSSPSASQRRSHSRQSSIEDIEARLSLAIANLSESNSSSDADADGDNDDDMYNDTPSCSSSQKRDMKAPKKSRRKEKSSSSSLSVFEEDEASDEDENGGTTIRIHLASGPTMRERGMRQVNAYEEDEEEEEDDSPFIPCYPLTPLETIYKPLHRIRRNRSLRRALSDSCATGALQSSPSTHERKAKSSLRTGGKGENERRVSFCNEVKVVDVFAAVDYPARRGPPPLERLTMRDVLELRQIKLELAAYMGEEYPSPEIRSSTKAIPSSNLFPPSQGTAMASSSSSLEIEHREEASMPTTPALEASPILEQASILECTALPSALTSSDGPASASALNGKGVSSARMSSKTQLGPGMEIDLHSLIAPPCSLGSFTISSSSTNTTVIIEDQIATSQNSPSPSSSSLPASTLSGYSSPTSGTSLSSESGLNSLSCSPATSDSEFGSGEGCSSSTSTYDDTPTSSRRGSDDASGDEDDVDVDADCHNGRNQVESAERMLDSGRTPTKLSLLRHGQFDNRPSIASSIRKRSLLNSDSNDKKMEIGRIQIALPAMAGDRFASSTTFDLSPMSTAAANDPWNPFTF